MYFFPGEVKVLARSPYAYRYSINGRIKTEGITSGKKMINLIQFKHHNVSTDKLFEFRPLFR